MTESESNAHRGVALNRRARKNLVDCNIEKEKKE